MPVRVEKLPAHVEHALQHGHPCGQREDHERPVCVAENITRVYF